MSEDLAGEDIVSRYKALADIERGFRVLKQDLRIAPMFHYRPDRIKAHAMLCFFCVTAAPSDAATIASGGARNQRWTGIGTIESNSTASGQNRQTNATGCDHLDR